MLAIRSIIFYASIILLTLLLIPLHILLTYISLYKIRFSIPILYTRLIILSLKIVGGVDYKITGLENFNRQQKHVVLINHQCAWETIFFYFFLSPVSPVVKKSLIYVPLAGWGFALLSPIMLNRKNKVQSFKKLLHDGADRLKQGFNLMLYPEGSRIEITGSKKFSKSGAMIAAQNNYPILPIAHNAGSFITKHFMIKRTGTIHIKIGAPLISKGQTMDELYTQSTNWIIENANA